MEVEPTSAATSSLTEEEAALYDRQIRLWGADAQKRLRVANVLLAGFRGILTEVCKNLVLAGVNNVTILDQDPIRPSDLAAQFFLREEDVGKTRAEALERIQVLNPQAKLTFESADIADKDEDYLRAFNVICISNQTLATIEKVNGICRKHGIPFYAADSFGYRAFFFADLGGHGYVVEEEKPKEDEKEKENGKRSGAVDAQPPVKRQRTEAEEPPAPKTGTVVAASPLFDIVHKVNWGHASMRRVPKLFFASLLLYMWSGEHGRRPYGLTSDEQARLVELKNAFLKKHNLRDNFLTDDFLLETARTAGAELSPICAIVGGILGQQVIKVISAKGEPEVHNLFFYDARSALGSVEAITV
jgi:ubiquitin-like 1-activating enzyme E1 A